MIIFPAIFSPSSEHSVGCNDCQEEIIIREWEVDFLLTGDQSFIPEKLLYF
jgi:hypothetical protein